MAPRNMLLALERGMAKYHHYLVENIHASEQDELVDDHAAEHKVDNAL